MRFTAASHACLAVAALATLALPAGAQTYEILPPGPNDRNRAVERPVEISVSYSLSMPLKSDGVEDQKQALEAGRVALYEIASKECANILAVIASSCKLARMNVQSSAQRGHSMRDSVTVTAAANYHIQLK